MKTEKIVWGLILIFIGSIFLLDNFNVINFFWGSVWRFWPIIFILIGANMLFSRFGNKVSAPILAASITIITLIFIGYQGLRPRSERISFHSEHFKYDYDIKTTTRDSGWSGTSNFTEPFTAGIQRAELNIQGGATSYKLSDTTSNLFDADVKQNYGRYTLEKTIGDSVEVLNFRMSGQKGRWINIEEMDDTNETRMRLNSAPVWDINVEMGAGEADFDLTSFKVRKLELKGGAASFEARLGAHRLNTDVIVETGVASVEIEVPSSAGCRIVVDSGLSSKDFIGFVKQSDGTYKTSNYDNATNKINISLKGGLSSFEVRKY